MSPNDAPNPQEYANRVDILRRRLKAENPYWKHTMPTKRGPDGAQITGAVVSLHWTFQLPEMASHDV